MSSNDSIRPSIALLAIAVLLGAGFTAYAVVSLASSTPESEGTLAESNWWRVDVGEPENEDLPSPAGRRQPVSSFHEEPFENDSYENAEWEFESEELDPQLIASQNSVGDGGDGGVPSFFYPTYRTGRIASVQGQAPVSLGTSCDIRVLPVLSSGFNCLIRVMCDDVVLYPDPSQGAGYVACNIEDGTPVAAVDDRYTYADGDPTVSYNIRTGEVTVTDENGESGLFAATLSLDPGT